MLKFVALILVGRLFLFFLHRFPLPKFLSRYNNVVKWHSCLLCSGAWVYTLLSAIFRVDLLTTLFIEIGISYTPFISELFTGLSLSYLMVLLEAGYKEQHLNIVVLE